MSTPRTAVGSPLISATHACRAASTTAIVAATLLGAMAFTAIHVGTATRPLRAEDWPQFRGANSVGVSANTKRLPTKFSATENLGWSTKIGDGVGGAVVAGGRVFVSGMTGPEQVSLFAFDASTGKRLWQRDWATGPLAEVHATNSQASSTPAADADRVYFYFSTLGLVTVDAKTGEDRWHAKLPTPFFVFKWGPGMSPVLYRDLVLFCQDDDLNPTFYAFDKATGKLRWKDDRLDMAVNYSLPVVCTVDGKDEIVVAGTGMLVGYDPQSGKRKWFAKVLLRNIKTTPVVQDGVIYISVQSGAIANQWLASVDRAEGTGNNDNKLDKAEIQAFVGKQKIPDEFFKKTFDRGDLNKDGFLEGKELDVAFLHPDNFAGGDFTAVGDAAAEQFILAVRGGGQGDVTKTHLLWKHKTKYTDHIVSPLVADGRMFLVKAGGITTVFGLKDGESLRGAKRLAAGGDYFASPVVGDGKVYLASDNGNVVVLKNDASYEELARNELGEPIIATPAIADGRLFVRTRTQLLCFGGEK
ncbi:MAG TPA: PQQ-binding-like beta-propeller repeat protein [Pirellulaceae bacterium]|nr:PQQ-binding-like beta-propeller repeat protein [Pirellulaceae bacterium]